MQTPPEWKHRMFHGTQTFPWASVLQDSTHDSSPRRVATYSPSPASRESWSRGLSSLSSLHLLFSPSYAALKGTQAQADLAALSQGLGLQMRAIATVPAPLVYFFWDSPILHLAAPGPLQPHKSAIRNQAGADLEALPLLASLPSSKGATHATRGIMHSTVFLGYEPHMY